MPEEIVTRINALMESLLTRLEAEVKDGPPQILEHTAVSVLNLYSLKNTLMNASERSRLEEQAIKEVVKTIQMNNGSRPPANGPVGPGPRLP